MAAIFIGWQYYIKTKYPEMYVKKDPAVSAQVNTNETPATAQPANLENQKPTLAIDSKLPAKEDIKTIEGKNLTLNVSTIGLGIKNLKIKNYTDRDQKTIQMAEEGTGALFELTVNKPEEKLAFKIIESSENKIVGVADYKGAKIERTITFDDATYSFNNQVKIVNNNKAILTVNFNITDKLEDFPAGSFFAPALDHQEVTVNHTDVTDRFAISNITDPVIKNLPTARLLGVGTRYFAAAMIDNSEIFPEAVVVTDLKNKTVHSAMVYSINSADGVESVLNFKTFAGPKHLDTLQKDPHLPLLIDLGFFSSIAKYLLGLLKWLNTFVSNWGVSIILLTLIVRFIVMPFNIFSYKSMKRMQLVQPQIQQLRERYKDDAKTLNQEIMVLMKEHKVNPLGGCLPMLLQMPVFFALYQVLGLSVDLYHAPFIFWIKDLSTKDPYFVLPILMGIAMFIQQKITPHTMDPQQARIMQFLPILFSLMTFGLPSGLTLYIFISTLFGVIQQQIFMRDSSTPVKIENKARA